MTSDKGVIGTFRRVWKTADAFKLPVGWKKVLTTRQYLMCIGLMPHVPHQQVFGRVHGVMQRHRKFNGTQIGTQVTGVVGQFIYNQLSNLIADLFQLIDFQLSEVTRVLDAVKKGCLRHIHESGMQKYAFFTYPSILFYNFVLHGFQNQFACIPGTVYLDTCPSVVCHGFLLCRADWSALA